MVIIICFYGYSLSHMYTYTRHHCVMLTNWKILSFLNWILCVVSHIVWVLYICFNHVMQESTRVDYWFSYIRNERNNFDVLCVVDIVHPRIHDSLPHGKTINFMTFYLFFSLFSPTFIANRWSARAHIEFFVVLRQST